jgi:hypothetical protein
MTKKPAAAVATTAVAPTAVPTGMTKEPAAAVVATTAVAPTAVPTGTTKKRTVDAAAAKKVFKCATVCSCVA